MALSELPPQKVVRKWHSLGDDKGEVELVLQWCYDADRDFEAFPEIDESGRCRMSSASACLELE